MLEKFKGKNVKIVFSSFAYWASAGSYKGKVTNINSEWVELDNNLTIAIKYIAHIKEI